ncbi:MAG: class I SAM-dependent methyltransferase [Deltaproteobacteria bacterium]|nr:class I SAM-dependent methyltransferase [Deltaproteobacteria bacterium]
MMIDRSLGYGRHIVHDYLKKSLPFNSVLDIGAGNGRDLLMARGVNRNAELHAIEYSDSYIANLKKHDINIYQIDIEKERLPFADESMDIVIANQILEHVKEIFWIFNEISRVLTVGGRLIIGVPNLASLHNRLLLLIGCQPTSIQLYSAHIRGFTISGFDKFLSYCWKGGYERIQAKGSNFYPFPPILARPLADFFPSLAWGIFMLSKKSRQYNDEFLKYPLENSLETNFFLGKDW